jgi:two-component system, NarL family, nitrate/nitrite response regulator NarL
VSLAALAHRRDVECVAVAVISPITIAREGLCEFLARTFSLSVEHQSSTSHEALDTLCETSVDVVLVDGSLPEGLAAIAEIRARVPRKPLLAYGVSPTPDALLACARNGATLVASHDLAASALVEMICRASAGHLEGQAAVNAALLERLASLVRGNADARVLALTRREREIALSLVDGLTNKEIAQRYSISLATVKSHVHRILRKIGAKRRDEVGYRLRDIAAM